MTGPFKEGDILGISHKGRDYLAWFVSEDRSNVKVKPFDRNITWFTVSKQEVVAKWRHSKGRWPHVKSNGGVNFG